MTEDAGWTEEEKQEFRRIAEDEEAASERLLHLFQVVHGRAPYCDGEAFEWGAATLDDAALVALGFKNRANFDGTSR